MSTLLVNEPLVSRILENPELRKIPQLAGVRYEVRLGGGCSGCGGRRSRPARVPPVEAVKQILYALPEQELQEVKAALNCTRLIFYFRQSGMPPRVIR